MNSIAYRLALHLSITMVLAITCWAPDKTQCDILELKYAKVAKRSGAGGGGQGRMTAGPKMMIRTSHASVTERGACRKR